MKKVITLIVALAFAVSCLTAMAQEGGVKEAKPKYTIKDVMKGAMKDGLNKKVLSGKATDKEKLALLDMYISLTENKAPKGEAASWAKYSNNAAVAAAKVAVGRKDGIAALKSATNCGKCHGAHKPKN